ncbi:Uncharacterized protein Ga0074115_12628 [endosymbiont of Ridgeia piscesae]|jgi:hypothetical protein|uniref:DUF2066 domain-containing protein n=4 Tax=endosymbiont of Ridgeia piscesae TaxID=54398 RepID=A0A0T5YZ08_9GAMM|nr:DUF2066 domain-containing protein [endosymbiont of Ridgeia piscesae]KRT55879.1 Uncharacterized protein Ga0074115_12628 [endosymbiont of Ridgeia piscesae]
MMSWHSVWVLLLLSALLLPGRVFAERVEGIYEAEVPVAGQSAAVRSAGIREAFARMLVKATGERELLVFDWFNSVQKRAPRYVQQYRYRMLPPPPAGEAAAQPVAEEAAAQPDRLLWVRFDERAVNRLLRDNGLPAWGSERPSTLVWLSFDNGRQRTLYQPEMEPELRESMQVVAQQRGLPLLVPLMDLEDQTAIQSSDIWGLFEQNIRSASERYLPDVVLVGRLRRLAANSWSADWTLYDAEGASSWQADGANRQQLAQQGVEQAGNLLVARFAPKAGALDAGTLRIRIAGVERLADYVLVRDYLKTLVMIEQLDLLQAEPDRVSFLARVQGGREALRRGIRLGGVLEPVVVEAPLAESAATVLSLDQQSLEYRLR